MSSAVTSRTWETEPWTLEISGDITVWMESIIRKSGLIFFQSLCGYFAYWSRRRDKIHCQYHRALRTQLNLLSWFLPADIKNGALMRKLVDTCNSRGDFPIPGSPPIRTRLPGTTPPPSTRLNSSISVLVRLHQSKWPQPASWGRVFSPVKETRACLTSAASTSSTKEDQAPAVGTAT